MAGRTLPHACTLPADAIDMHVGGRLRERRRAMGLTQTQLGQIVEVSFQQVQKYERGTNRISASTLLRFARALEVAPGWFFEGLAPDRATESPAPGPLALLAADRDWANLAPEFLALSPIERATIVKLARVMAWRRDIEADKSERAAA